jgi:hypothetical protein
METHTILERMRFLKDQMNEIEKRMTDESLTLTELEQLDGEWDILDAELEHYDEILEADHYRQMWEISQLEEPIEEDLYSEVPRDEEEDYVDMRDVV